MSFKIANDTNETEYIKQFRTSSDCYHWIVDHLDLSLNWFTKIIS